jgi:hypothetical protein
VSQGTGERSGRSTCGQWALDCGFDALTSSTNKALCHLFGKPSRGLLRTPQKAAPPTEDGVRNKELLARLNCQTQIEAKTVAGMPIRPDPQSFWPATLGQFPRFDLDSVQSLQGLQYSQELRGRGKCEAQFKIKRRDVLLTPGGQHNLADRPVQVFMMIANAIQTHGGPLLEPFNGPERGSYFNQELRPAIPYGPADERNSIDRTMFGLAYFKSLPLQGQPPAACQFLSHTIRGVSAVRRSHPEHSPLCPKVQGHKAVQEDNECHQRDGDQDDAQN